MREIWPNDTKQDELLWRYFKPERLLESLGSRTLHFPSARQFSDPFEGAVAVLRHDFPVDPRYQELSPIDRAFEDLRRLTKLTCWHRADYESHAMWHTYAAAGKGVAVRTTPQRLQSSLRPFRLKPKYAEEVPYYGNVRYVDLHAVRLRASMDERFFYKHRAFESEREFRVAIFLRHADFYGVEVPEQGIDVEFDPAVLIESIYFGPFLSEADRLLIGQACQSVGVTVQPVFSSLLGQPRYV